MSPGGRAPRVSVVMPLFDKGPYVQASIASVLAQTMGDFELVVVDDGSRDDGPARVSAIADRRVRLLRFPNGGVSVARNRGVEAARSGLVAFLDADDLWEPAFLEKGLAALEGQPGLVAAFCAYYEGDPPRCRMPLPREELVIQDYPGWYIRSRGRGLWCSNSLVRRDSLIAAGGFPPGVQNGEDTDTWFRLSFRGPVVYVPEPLCRYGCGDGASLSRRYRAVEPVVIGSIREALAAGTVPGPARASARAAIDYFKVAYAAALAMEGRRGAAARELLKARPRPRLWRAYARVAFALIFGR